MRRFSLGILLAAGLSPLFASAPLTAQRAGPVRTSLLPGARAVEVPRLKLPQDPAPAARARTSFLQRAAWGAGAAFLGVAAASALVADNDGAWVALPLIGAASAAGVMLVTAKHEGARPVSTALGTAIAMTIPGLLLANIESGPEGPGPKILVGFALLVSAPLGAAAGHGLGVR